jgi:hypothetical protein
MNAYVDDIREGGVSVYDSGLKIGTEPPGPVEVLIKTNGGTVQGVVSHSQQKPKAGAVVVVALVPSGSRRQNPALFKTVLTSELLAGRFVFRGVQPGPYKVFAWENIVPAVIQDPAFLAKYEQRGHAILVNPSTTTAADIDLISSQE